MGLGTKVLGSFIGGIIFTLVLLLVIPDLCDTYIRPLVEQYIGNVAFAWFTSSTIVTIVMLGITLAFMAVFGSGFILKYFGVTGIMGLLFGYWLLDRLEDAVIPVGVLIIFVTISFTRRKKKEKREKQEAERKKLEAEKERLEAEKEF